MFEKVHREVIESELFRSCALSLSLLRTGCASQHAKQFYYALLRTCGLLRDHDGAVVEPDVWRDRRALRTSGAALRQRQIVWQLGVFAKDIPSLEPERMRFSLFFENAAIFFVFFESIFFSLTHSSLPTLQSLAFALSLICATFRLTSLQPRRSPCQQQQDWTCPSPRRGSASRR